MRTPKRSAKASNTARGRRPPLTLHTGGAAGAGPDRAHVLRRSAMNGVVAQ